jgi:hypothetical protein
MGYNISETTGSTGGGTAGLDTWTFQLALDGSNPTGVSGDFAEIPIGGGTPTEPSNGYSFGSLSTTQYGTLTFTDTTTGQFTFTLDKAALIASGSDQVVTFTVTGDDGGSTDTDTVIINLLICVARGTEIGTPDGPVPVEELKPGDFVSTRDRGPRPVRWIGSRRVTPFEMRTDPSLRPIRIMPGALGPGRPARALRVSPQHRILVGDWRTELFFGEDEVLVPAKALADGDRIHVDRAADEVEYFHVLFDTHEIMMTEGLPTESFHPGDYALREMEAASRRELLAILPVLAEPGSGPPTARMALRGWEGRLLQSRQPEPDALRMAS